MTDEQSPVEKGSKCPCGQDIPWHLFDLGLEGFTHVCSCERCYRLKNGDVAQDEAKRNPVAEFDRTQQN